MAPSAADGNRSRVGTTGCALPAPVFAHRPHDCHIGDVQIALRGGLTLAIGILVAVRPVIGFMSDRAGRRWVIVTGLTVCGAAVLLVSIATNLTTTITAILVYAAGVATTTAATSAYITDVTRRARYGAAHGVSIACNTTPGPVPAARARARGDA